MAIVECDKEAWMRCTLMPGQFSSELAVVIKSFSDRTYSLFVPKIDLRYSIEPEGDKPVDGLIKVECLKQENDLCLVKLPQSTLENGFFVTVRNSELVSPSGQGYA